MLSSSQIGHCSGRSPSSGPPAAHSKRNRKGNALMSSELRLRANRANAARSTGPVTPEGKAYASRNALRHGFLAKQILAGTEPPAAFREVFDLFAARWSPVDDIEIGMLEEMAAAYWRLRRAWAMETEMLRAAIETQPGR